MLLRQTLRHLVVITWEVEAAQVAQALPRGLEPQLAGEAGLVSVVGARSEPSRFGPLPLPGWSQVVVRSYVHAPSRRESGIYIWLARASVPGGAGAAFGLPMRTTLVRVDDRRIDAPGVGLALGYRTGVGAPVFPDTVPAVGEHDVAYHPRWGNPRRLGRFVARHGPIDWVPLELDETPRLDPVLALGFDLGAPCSCLYARGVDFVSELPPKQARL